MAGAGLEADVVVVGVVLGALVVQRHVDVALPHEVLDQGLGLHDLLDAGQLHGLWRLAIGQGHLAGLGGLQRLGALTAVGVLLDQHLLVALQGLDLFPVQGDGTAIRGFQQQLAAVEDFDLAAETVTVLHPYGVGEHRGGAEGNSKQAQQGSRIHKRAMICGLRVRFGEKSRALSG